MFRKPVRAGLLCSLLIGVVLAAPAPGMPLAQVRIASLRAVLADVAAVAAATGKPLQGEALLASLLAQVGIADPNLVDATRPVVAVLPLEGMLLQQRGVVLALPVAEPAPLLEAVAAGYPARTREGPLEVFHDATGPALYALAREGYVVAGQTRDFVAGFDPALIHRPWDGPPGSVAGELFLEPLVPLLQAGLMGAREQFKQQLQQTLNRPQEGPLGAPPVDGAAVAEIADFYLGMMQSVLMDLSRMQIGLQIDGQHLLYHHRLIPKPGTETAEFFALQGGGLPHFSRVVVPGAVNLAGQVRLTPRLQQALTAFVSSYLRLARRLSVGEESGQPALAEYLAALESLLADAVPCFTGELVAGIDFSLLAGMNVVEAMGVVDTPECRSVTRKTLDQLRQLGSAAGDSTPLRYAGEETLHGVAVQHYSTDVTVAQEQLPSREREMLQLIYGGTALPSYIAATGPVTYYALGSAARTQLAAMLGADHDSERGGVAAETFHPLQPGPGLFAGLELHQLIAFALDVLPADDPGRPGLERVAQNFSDAGGTGRMTLGFRFEPKGGLFQLALPLPVLSAQRELQPLPVTAGPKED